MTSNDLSDGVEVSNACRRFYVSRLQAAETLKQRLTSDRGNESDTLKACGGRQRKKPESFQTAMAQLRSELASLIDVDLEVMRQLLMLNDQVEELKWQRRQSLTGSTTLSSPAYDLLDIDGSSWSRDSHHNNRWSFEVSTLDRSPMMSFGRGGLSKYPTPSALSLLRASSQDCCSSIEDLADGRVDSPSFDTEQPRESCAIKLFINNNSMEQSSYQSNSSASEDNGPDKADVMKHDEKLKAHDDVVVMKRQVKERPAVKPKPKSVVVKGGELKVSFATSVTCKTPETTTISPGSSSSADHGTRLPGESTPPVTADNITKDDVIMRKSAARVNTNSEKVEKQGKLKDSTAMHSSGAESFHELSTFVEMLI